VLDREFSAYVRFSMPALLVGADEVGVASDVLPMAEVDASQIQADLLVTMGAFDEAETRLSRARMLDARYLNARLNPCATAHRGATPARGAQSRLAESCLPGRPADSGARRHAILV
jgi:hypothetical protein